MMDDGVNRKSLYSIAAPTKLQHFSSGFDNYLPPDNLSLLLGCNFTIGSRPLQFRYASILNRKWLFAPTVGRNKGLFATIHTNNWEFLLDNKQVFHKNYWYV